MSVTSQTLLAADVKRKTTGTAPSARVRSI